MYTSMDEIYKHIKTNIKHAVLEELKRMEVGKNRWRRNFSENAKKIIEAKEKYLSFKTKED